MVARVATVAFEGVEARPVDVQVQVANGAVAAVTGIARERVRAALVASGLALPARRITVNLAPADLPKEGSHYDLPVALAVMAAIGAIPADALDGYAVIGELRSTARSARSPACCPRRSPPTRAASASSVRPPAGRRRPGPRPTSTSSRRAR